VATGRCEQVRILHVVHQYWPAITGSSLYIQKLAERLARDGHDVTVFTSDALDQNYFWLPSRARVRKRRETVNGVDVRRFRVAHLRDHHRRVTKLWKAPFQWCGYMFDHPRVLLPGLIGEVLWGTTTYDLVLGGVFPFSAFCYAAYRVAQRSGAPFVLCPMIHLGEPGDANLLEEFITPRRAWLLDKADAVLVNTEVEKGPLVSAGVPESRVVVAHPAVDPEEVVGGCGATFRRRHGIDGPIVFQISTQTHDKGSHHLVEAMKIVWSSLPEARLVLAGPILRDFEDYFYAQPPWVFERTYLLGAIDDEEKRDLLAAGDVLAMVSRADSFGIVFLEAWLYEKPVVGGAAGGIPAVVTDGRDGVLVPFADVHMIAEVILRLLSNTELGRRLGQAGRRKVAQRFTWDVTYPRVAHLYDMLMNERNGRAEARPR
jgi:glycosyltransferase involved in cell wall biosynthesis